MAQYILLIGGAVVSINAIAILSFFKWRRMNLSLVLRLVFWFQLVTGLVFLLTGIMK